MKYGTWKGKQHAAGTQQTGKSCGNKRDRRGSTQGADGHAPTWSIRRRLPLNKLCINGAYTEDRAGWDEEQLKGHCGRIYDDPEEDKGTQERSVRVFRENGSRETTLREEGITVDLALRARGNMHTDKANGPRGHHRDGDAAGATH